MDSDCKLQAPRIPGLWNTMALPRWGTGTRRLWTTSTQSYKGSRILGTWEGRAPGPHGSRMPGFWDSGILVSQDTRSPGPLSSLPSLSSFPFLEHLFPDQPQLLPSLPDPRSLPLRGSPTPRPQGVRYPPERSLHKVSGTSPRGLSIRCPVLPHERAPTPPPQGIRYPPRSQSAVGVQSYVFFCPRRGGT